MKTAKIFLVVVILTGAAAYARAAEGAGTPAAPGQSVVVSTAASLIKLSAMPLDTLRTNIKTSKDNDERRQYVGALSYFKPKTEKDVSMLVDLAIEDNGKGIANESAIKALMHVGPDSKNLEPMYVKLLEHKNAYVQSAAMVSCGVFRSKKALPILIERLKKTSLKAADKDKDELSRTYGVIMALGSYGKEGFPELLKLARETKDSELKKLTISVMKGISDKEAAPQFMEVARNNKEDPDIRNTAIEMVGQLAAQDNMVELREIYRTEKNEITQHKLIRSVASSKSENIVQFLQDIIEKDPVVSNRGVAAFSLGQVGGEKAIAILLKAWETETDKETRMDIAYSLRQLTGKDFDWRKSNEK